MNVGRTVAAQAALLALLACDPSVDRPDVGNIFDRDMSVSQLERPTLKAFEMNAGVRVPYNSVNLTGNSNGARVFIEGATANRLVAPVGIDGTFCIDVPLPNPGLFTFRAIAHGAEGDISEPSPDIVVERADNAAELAGAVTCSGADPAGCSDVIERCDDGIDNNCNGLRDGEDPMCAVCMDDVFERNDDVNAPRVEPMLYTDLQICPGSPDYFGIFARQDEVITAEITFMHTEGNLDLELIGVNRIDIIQNSRTLMDVESISHTATTTGEYKIRIVADPGVANAYDLDLRVGD